MFVTSLKREGLMSSLSCYPAQWKGRKLRLQPRRGSLPARATVSLFPSKRKSSDLLLGMQRVVHNHLAKLGLLSIQLAQWGN
jgi:hypothetical protein